MHQGIGLLYKKKLHVIVLVFALTSGLEAQTVIEIEQLKAQLRIDLTYDPFFGTLSLSRGDQTLTIDPSSGVASLNAVQLIQFPPGGILIANGTISNQAFTQILTIFPKPIEDEKTIKTIFIDPGHGGKDPGAIGKFSVQGKQENLQEKDIVLAVALELKILLERAYPEKKIVLSRETDIYLPLEERTKLANRFANNITENTLFISIHANSSPSPRAQGYEAWYLPAEYRRTLIEEGDVSALDKDALALLNTIVEEEYTVNSIILAKNILSGLDQTLGDSRQNRGIKAEEWYVVRSARMPSVLLELGFVTNQDDFNLMRQPDYLKKLAQGIYNGLSGFVSTYEK